MRIARRVGTRVANANGKLPASIAKDFQQPPRARTFAELCALPNGTVVEWPGDIERLTRRSTDAQIQFEVDKVETACGCSKSCAQSDCRNRMQGVVCVTRTCSQSSTSCGRRMKDARGLELRVKDEDICLYTSHRIRENYVVCPFIGKLGLTDTLDQYTVKLKTKDKRNRNVFLAVGNMGRFISHRCEANCRIEELNGDDGPEVAIVATRVIKPGEEIIARLPA